ncbi:hypothetical protein [Cupriavidus necator]
MLEDIVDFRPKIGDKRAGILVIVKPHAFAGVLVVILDSSARPRAVALEDGMGVVKAQEAQASRVVQLSANI